MPQTRRVPTQRRSKEKYDLVLKTAKQLIGENGNDAVSMREIAKAADIPISSIYQYFPDKNTILEAIMQGYFDDIREPILGFIKHCDCVDDLKGGLTQAINLFYNSFQEEPVLATLWAGLQANPKLRELDAEDSQLNAKMIAEKFCCLCDKHSFDTIYNSVLLLLHTAGMTARLALEMPEKEATAFIEEYKLLAMLRLDSML